MRFTDLFIRRPVLAVVVNLFLLLLGAVAVGQLEEREFPKVEESQVIVKTEYPGASAAQVQSFVTTPLQKALAGVEGVDHITSTTLDNKSTIRLDLIPDYDANVAVSEVASLIAPVKNEFPETVEYPVVSKSGGRLQHVMYLRVQSTSFTREELTEYVEQVIEAELTTLPNVGTVVLYGHRKYAMRLWLDPIKLASFDITVDEFRQAISASNYLTPAGTINSSLIETPVSAKTDLNSVDQFADIVIRQRGDKRVQVKDVAIAELAAERTLSASFFNGQPAIAISIIGVPGASPIAVSREVRAKIDALRPTFPPGLVMNVNFDVSISIEDSMTEVYKTIFAAVLIVLMVVFLFLGDIRTVIVPVVAIPLSLFGNFFLMSVLGYSINLFSLLAVVLAVGLVVDDAIVVVENIHRHIEQGLSALEAALEGAREIAMPVVSMTLTLAAVYAPMGFVSGGTGQMVREFVYTLAGAVILSGFVALTLSPMMCSKLMAGNRSTALSRWLDRHFEALQARYRNILLGTMTDRPVIVVMLIAFLACLYPLNQLSNSELVPVEDIGILNAMFTPPPNTNISYLEKESAVIDSITMGLPEYGGKSFRFLNVFEDGKSFVGAFMTDWRKRERTTAEILPEFAAALRQVPGVEITPFMMNRAPGASGGLPIELVIKTTRDYLLLEQIGDALLSEIWSSGLFLVGVADLEFDKPELVVEIDRNKAAQLGIPMESIGSSLSLLLGEGEIGKISLYGRSYKIIPQAMTWARDGGNWLEHYHVRTTSGKQVPLSSVIETRFSAKPASLKQFQQQNSMTLSMAPAAGGIHG